MVPGKAASKPPGNLLEMNIIWAHPSSTHQNSGVQESVFKQTFQVILTHAKV